MDIGEDRSHWVGDRTVMRQAIAEVGTRADIEFLFDTEWGAKARTNLSFKTGQRFRRGPPAHSQEHEQWIQSVQDVLAPAEHIKGHTTAATEVCNAAKRGEPIGMGVMTRSGRCVTAVMENQRTFMVESYHDREASRVVQLATGERERHTPPTSRSAGADFYWLRILHRHDKFRSDRRHDGANEKTVEEFSMAVLYLNQSARISARECRSCGRSLSSTSPRSLDRSGLTLPLWFWSTPTVQ